MNAHDVLVDLDSIDQRAQIDFAERHFTIRDVFAYQLPEAGKLLRVKPTSGCTLIRDTLQR
ncbi:hypothetical protein [Ancylobacter sonchi]|uniref:hypothetical protein n=1 Tax=Ancylobacter sonchi TaxID=1937790 RepID=UPI001FE9A2BB|nr:hypothetical protein [Ancylobacter sonchi]